MKKKKLVLVGVFALALFLRLFQLTEVPASLYWEETALGYDAYSILKTGRDFHGNRLPISAFESFGDWKPSLYFYALVPSIAVFGLSEWAVRLPSALFGCLTVVLTYFLTKELFIGSRLGKSGADWLGIIAGLLLAVSPWHLQFSRAGFEVVLAVFLITSGIYFFLKAVNKNQWFLVLAAFCLALSAYAYHAARIFSPLLALGLGLIFFPKLLKSKKAVITAFLLSLAILSPLLREVNQPQVRRRFQETSALATLAPILESNQKIEEDGNTRLAKLVHHRFWHYLDIFLDHYFDHFRPGFLFLSGDKNPRHQTGELGLFFFAQAPLLLAGGYFIFRHWKPGLAVVLLWLVLGPVPAGLTKATPHALRLLISVPAWQIVSAYGAYWLVRNLKSKLAKGLMIGGMIGLWLVCSWRYFHFYYHHYPRLHSQSWQYGYKQMVDFVLAKQSDYDQVYITSHYGRPSIYYFFYGQIDPGAVQAEEGLAAQARGERLEFKNINFQLPEEGEGQGEVGKKRPDPGRSLVVASNEEYQALADQPALLKTIYFLDNQPAFLIYEI